MTKPLSKMSRRELTDVCIKGQQRSADLAAQVKGPDDFATWKDAAVDERVKRVAAEKREQALAAHVEHLKQIKEITLAYCPEVVSKCFVFGEEAPTTSLARRDARMKAAALTSVIEEAPLIHADMLAWIDEQIRVLCRQAEE